MARDTRGPSATDNLQRVSLNPPRWRNGRWLLAAEGVISAVIGTVGLVTIYFVSPIGAGISLFGVPLTATLSWVMLGLAVGAFVATAYRRLALVFCAVVSVCTLGFEFVAAVAGSRDAPGPMGFTSAAIFWWAVLFCYNFGLGFWLIPDHIEGPEWVWRRRKSKRSRDEQRS
ncbi:hypothetical protein A5647_04340 [Mycobacterium sp. 1100029.7]|nr:hypothetical protein A5647_04340 [Mycobacterium sp. 1100029.7]